MKRDYLLLALLLVGNITFATYAIPFYQSLGFDKIAGKQCTNGITYTPMKFTISNFKE